ncbi:toxin-antitoxin system YwqK family antitoxin [Chryseobacterium sp. MIQD13]|uniref:toxin-antitoxin system YwqK family antitoxin n=1 Tax=Chryseobacterium sp. MIQD13 TaxID=3422310 RepID=UPI003D2A0068
MILRKVLFFSILILLVSCSATKTTVNENEKNGEGKSIDHLKNGKRNFYKNGRLNSTGKYSRGEKTGKWKYFYPNGKIHQRGQYIKDKQNGIWNYYFDSGEFMGKGELKDDKQTGLWKWYYKNGNLYTERFYDKGKLIRINSCFDKNGKLLDCGKIINGNGMMIFHDIENESDTIQTFNYRNGIIVQP